MTVGELIEALGKYDPNALVGASRDGKQDEVYGIEDIIQMDTHNYYGEIFSNIVAIRVNRKRNYGMNQAEFHSLHGKNT